MFIRIFKRGIKFYSASETENPSHNAYGCSYLEIGHCKVYRYFGNLHNELGPAIIYLNDNHTQKDNYWLLGERYDYKNWKLKTSKKGGNKIVY